MLLTINLSDEIFNLYLFLTILPLIGYAEIHHRFPFLPGRLFKKEPEIVFDLPRRACLKTAVPLFLFIKDANLFPVRLKEIQLKILNRRSGNSRVMSINISQVIRDNFFSHTVQIPESYFEEAGCFEVTANLSYINSRNKAGSVSQDNYRGIPHPPFHIYIAEDPLPAPKGWYWGDLHLHSNYTSDQVEFGAPLAETVMAARSFGLQFVAITDHSYDLDDQPDNYLKNDSKIKKWKNLRSEISNLRHHFDDFLIIPGEEVSVGNHKNRNIHCLVLNDPNYHPGSGDSAEKLFQNKPTLSLPDLLRRVSPPAVAIAAHPTVRPPLSQKFVLRRGHWEENDCIQNKLTALQIFNGLEDKSLQEGLSLWKKLLLKGRRLGIVAGNDAHGNFNCFRQIKIPTFSMEYSRNNTLGYMRTGVFSQSLDLCDIMDSLRNMQTIVSTGPFAILEIAGSTTAITGGTCRLEKNSRIKIRASSTGEYGSFTYIKLYYGSYSREEEILQVLNIPVETYHYSNTISLPNSDFNYIRLEAISMREQKNYFCITNPIWIEKE